MPILPSSLLWEDSTSLVVNKPSGILTQGPPGIETLETRLRAFIKRRDAHPGEPYIAFPHRIDRAVSGALLVARNVRATRRFGAQFQSRKIGKIYWALCGGRVDPDEGTWTDHLRKIPDQPIGECCDETAPGARIAVLHYRVVDRGSNEGIEPTTRLEIRLETGRMHQIRIQCASRGWPLLGDATYGSVIPFGPPESDPRRRPIALHAREICFRHPTSGVETRVTAPLPSLWGA